MNSVKENQTPSSNLDKKIKISLKTLITIVLLCGYGLFLFYPIIFNKFLFETQFQEFFSSKEGGNNTGILGQAYIFPLSLLTPLLVIILFFLWRNIKLLDTQGDWNKIKEGDLLSKKIEKALTSTLCLIAISSTWILFFIILYLLYTVAWHKLSPFNFRWLSEEDIKSIEFLAFSGSVSSLITISLRKLVEIGNKKTDE